jgi:hypothetical protein
MGAYAENPIKTHFDGFGRGVMVFGDYTVDLGYGIEYAKGQISGERFRSNDRTRAWAAKIETCSDDRYYCLRSKGRFSLVAPRRCLEPKVGDTWTVAGLTTQVLATYEAPWLKNFKDQPAPESGGPLRYYALGDPGRPDVVFFYAPRDGVTQVVIGSRRAGSTAIKDLRDGLLDPYAHASGPFLPLVTPDTVAACS